MGGREAFAADVEERRAELEALAESDNPAAWVGKLLLEAAEETAPEAV